MPSHPRRDVVIEGAVGIYYAFSQCVRQIHLFGADEEGCSDYSYRKEWVPLRLRLEAAVFGIDILDYAGMDDCIHLILRTRPDLVDTWDDEDVARRWLMIDSQHLHARVMTREQREREVKAILEDSARLTELRGRLSSLSWFMRYLCEPISRTANKEDEVTGHLWASRFHCLRLEDESALLACSAHVNLSAVLAGKAPTPETSRFTSIYERIHARQRRKTRQSGRVVELIDAAEEVWEELGFGDQWLSPVGLEEETGDNVTLDGGQVVAAVAAGAVASIAVGSLEVPLNGCGEQYNGEQDSGKKVSASSESAGQVSTWKPAARACNKGYLSVAFEPFLELLQWTACQLREGQREAMPAHLATILQRLHIDVGSWLELVQHFGRLFHRAAGRPCQMDEAARRWNKRWLHGSGKCRQVFAA